MTIDDLMLLSRDSGRVLLAEESGREIQQGYHASLLNRMCPTWFNETELNVAEDEAQINDRFLSFGDKNFITPGLLTYFYARRDKFTFL